MKIALILAFFSPLIINAQKDSADTRKIEINLKYAMQCPLYSVNKPSDLALSQDTKYKSRISLGIKYYPYRRWYTEYLASFSREGGGYKEQRTNANYFKNSILLGYGALHSHRIVFDMFSGIEMNLLLNARLINTCTKESEKVSDYYHKFNLSLPIGLGFKTKIFQDYHFSCHTFVSFSPYTISKEPYIRTSQIIFPAFQFGISKFLK